MREMANTLPPALWFAVALAIITLILMVIFIVLYFLCPNIPDVTIRSDNDGDDTLDMDENEW